jgi:acyl-coenzyme A thioesterase PaaI-like protein
VSEQEEVAAGRELPPEGFEGSLQQRWLPEYGCFGCGPANPEGLHLMCHADGGEVVAEWRPEPHHNGPPGVMHGGLVGALFDCHGAWTAEHHVASRRDADAFVPIVTAEYAVRLRRPTPVGGPVWLRGRVVEEDARRVVVESEVRSGDQVTATYRGTYVELDPSRDAR